MVTALGWPILDVVVVPLWMTKGNLDTAFSPHLRCSRAGGPPSGITRLLPTDTVTLLPDSGGGGGGGGGEGLDLIPAWASSHCDLWSPKPHLPHCDRE